MRMTTAGGRAACAGAALAACAAGQLALPEPACAQEWPARPVRLLVGFPVGGAADILARLHATRLQDAIGQAVVVDNRGGASGQLAAAATAKATPDGYT